MRDKQHDEILLQIRKVGATAAAVAFKDGTAASFTGDGTVGGTFVLALFGLLATIGLVTYNTRNDQLYDDLVGRAASIERSLGLADGAFANRPYVWLSFRVLDIRWKVDHRTGVGTIYWTSIIVWLFLLLASLSAPLVSNLGPGRTSLAVLAAAVIAAWSARTWIKRKKKQVEGNMRCVAARAVQKALSTNLSPDRELIALCAELVGDGDHDMISMISARAQFYAAVDRDSSGYFDRRGSKLQAACHLVALLTDLPPRQLFDWATNRRGDVEFKTKKPDWFPLRSDETL
jgi:hypothetical protein